MRPYKVDYLMGKENIPEDLFELVGVLVHSGTAESGHYYSYVRERPSAGGKQPWVEFNDEIVTSWDSSTMETCCFGGPDARPVNDTIYDKSYSAYMLFYQRSSTVADQQQILAAENLSSPVKLDVPSDLGCHIAMENELILRKYCLYEPSHTILVSRMLGHARKLNGGRCSESHDTEKFALRAALSHLDQVVSRTKDIPQFSGYLGAISRICQTCAECSRDYLEYYIDCIGALRHLLLRNPDSLVRNEIANSILSALKKVKADAAYAYGLNDDSEPEEQPPRIIHRFVKSLETLFDFFHFNTRAWPEYFGLLMDIANLGREEATILLDNEFLQKMLSIVCTDPALTTDQQYLRMWNNVSKRMTTRPVSYEAVIGLLCRLLQTCDGSLEPISDDWDRALELTDGKPVPLSETEHDLLSQQWTRTNVNVLADKLLRINQNDYATRAIVVWLVEWHRRQKGFADLAIRNTILHGLQRSSPAPRLAPFLSAALIYCELSNERDSISSIINEVAHAAYSAQHLEGKEFVQFFHAITKLSTNKSDTTREEIIQLVVRSAPVWGPALLTSYDAGVREHSENLVHNLIWQQGDDLGIMQDNDGQHPCEREAARQLAVACLEYIEETYLQQRVTAVNANMLNIQVMIEALSASFSDDEDEKESVDFHLRKERRLARTYSAGHANY
jgi:ubiquitin carboxyl-terminal hydrolase 34